MTQSKKDTLSAYLMLSPFYLFFIVFVIVPIIVGLFFSITRFSLAGKIEFIGLTNYIDAIDDKIFIKSLGNTFIYAIGTLFFSLVIGLILANVLSSQYIKYKGVFRTAIFIPYIPSMVSLSIVWLWFYDPSSGVFNNILASLGFHTSKWIYDKDISLFCIIFMSVWRYVGYVMIIYLAAMQLIPQSLYESADIDGANAFVKFIKITIPLLKPTTFFLVVTLSIQSFSVFEQVYIMTDGGPRNATTTIVHQIYSRAFTELRYGYASALASVLFIIVAIITFVNFRYGKEGYNIEF